VLAVPFGDDWKWSKQVKKKRSVILTELRTPDGHLMLLYVVNYIAFLDVSYKAKTTHFV
jgi:hypothetical protein